MQTVQNLTKPLQVGDLLLPHRVVMAPLTRCRANNPGRVPNDLMRKYYEQRSSMALILTEATCVSPQGVGYPDTPGIWSEEQVEGWKKITDAVHKNNGKIFLQLWHVGRVSDPVYLNGELPVAPSAIACRGQVSLLRPKKDFVTPRALENFEVVQIVQDYKKAAQNAKLAGFDGVEVHAANGYLIDQFLQSSTNKRTDNYGGSIENRCRLLMEVTDACIQVWGAGRVGVHLAPRMDSHDMGDENPKELFSAVARKLREKKIAFICAREKQGPDSLGPLIKKEFGGVFIANEQFNPETANQVIADGQADAVAFGVLSIANPDLPKRIFENKKITTPQPATFYAAGEIGYTDYAFSE